MNYKKGLVSVVMPTFNQSHHISDAIESIRQQDYPDFEFIIVMDGMDERTLERIVDGVNQPWPTGEVKFPEIHEENLGTAEAINTGMRRARGEYVTWVSSDNTMTYDWLSSLVKILDAEPDVDAIYSSYWREEGSLMRGHWQAHQQKQLMPNGPYVQGQLVSNENCVCGPAFLWRHELVDRVGDQRGAISHDYDYWLRIEEEGKIGWHPMPLSTYRVHDERVTITRADTYDARKWQDEAHDRRS